MKREIKFRAWDKEGNVYENEVPSMISMEEWELRYKSKMPMPWKTSRWVFMQHIGMLDYYEGDILKSNNSGEVGVIEYHENYLGYWVNFNDGREWSNLFKQDDKYYTKIGNIYENPSLLSPSSNQ